ncbi:hypothetical protein A2U01_0000456 [Trifolium medium]|uniref:Uncharacterized protein n=1 Tax=Trifolium medium TaxID=97028 RepID=A0A392LXM1_9FABA|nr:hypothetical protein [Trifolium medium]
MIAYVPKWIMKTSSWNSAFFNKPTNQMRSHLKPLFIKAEVNEDFKVNKVLIDGGAVVNLMPESFLLKIDKSEKDLMDHNIVITDFNGNSAKSMGIIVVKLKVGSVTRSTVFIVVPSKANYNLLLGREWIHTVGAIPSTVHQAMVLWREDDYVEYIDVDDTTFKVAGIGVLNSDKMLEKMGPCNVETFEQWKECCGDKVKITLCPRNGFEVNEALNTSQDGQEVAHHA